MVVIEVKKVGFFRALTFTLRVFPGGSGMYLVTHDPPGKEGLN